MKYIHVHIHEMLRKKGKATQHNRKTKQHNTTRPRQLFFKEKSCLGWYMYMYTYMYIYMNRVKTFSTHHLTVGHVSHVSGL